jgi:hypothetical protein
VLVGLNAADDELAAVPEHVYLGPHVLRAEPAAMAAGVLLAALCSGRVKSAVLAPAVHRAPAHGGGLPSSVLGRRCGNFAETATVACPVPSSPGPPVMLSAAAAGRPLSPAVPRWSSRRRRAALCLLGPLWQAVDGLGQRPSAPEPW